MFNRFVAALAILTASSAPLAAQDAKLSDPQIAHIATTAGDIDINAAELALKKAKNGAVRAFAKEMVRDHKSVNQKAAALLQKLGVTAQDNDTSQGLVQQAEEKRATLEKLSGADFDKAYIANEAAFHRVIDDALRDTLIPGAGNAELRDFLQTSLKMFEGHQQHAEKIGQDLDKPVEPRRRTTNPKQT